MVTYRTTDNARWGVGKEANLTPVEIDENFWSLEARIISLEQNPVAGNGITSIQVTGSQMTVFLQDGSTQGPFTLPIAMIHYRGDYAATANYDELDLIAVPDDALYLVLRTHISANEFDPDAVDANGNRLYRRLVPIGGISGGGGGSALIVEEIILDEQSHTTLNETAINKYLRVSHLWSEGTIYVPDDADADIPINTQIWIENNADAPLLISSWNIALVNGEDWQTPWDIGGLYSVALLTKVGANEWTLKQFGGGGAAVLNDLNNVNANPTPEVAGQVLTWDGWVWGAADPASGGGGITDAPTDGSLYGRLNGAWSIVPSLIWNNIGNKPATFPPSVHGHGWDEISDKPVIITALPDNIGAAGTVLKAQADGSIVWAVDETGGGDTLLSHQYWRVRITEGDPASGAPGAYVLAEVRLGSADLAGGVPIFSSQISPNIAANAFDGDPSTVWQSSTSEDALDAIGYQFASPVSVDVVTLQAGNTASRAALAPISFIVQSSDDGVNWTDEWTVTGEPVWAISEQRIYDRPAPSSSIDGNGSILRMIAMTQAEYDAIVAPDPNTFYVISG